MFKKCNLLKNEKLGFIKFHLKHFSNILLFQYFLLNINVLSLYLGKYFLTIDQDR